MYFSIEPKTKRSDLFGMNYQLDLLKKYLLDRDTRIIIIKGLRRTGKTSLLNVALNEVNIESVKIDVRDAPFYDRREFIIFLIKKIKERDSGLIRKIIKNIAGVKLEYKEVSIELIFNKEENINLFFSSLNSELKRENKEIILAFDEAQLLKAIDFDYFLASIFDNYKNIKLLLTGSEIGLLDNLLGKLNYKAPLFGRAYLEIEIEKIKEEGVKEFLEEGFKQINKKIDFEELREVIENLDGIIGWATYYGWFRYKGFSHQKALEKVKEEGKVIIKKELENFLLNRKAKIRYLKLINYIAKGHNAWDLLKQAFRKEGIDISDSQLNLYLKELINFGFIEKLFEKYFISDPLLSIVR